MFNNNKIKQIYEAFFDLKNQKMIFKIKLTLKYILVYSYDKNDEILS